MTDSGRLVLVIEQIALLRPLDTLRMRLACPHRRAIVRSRLTIIDSFLLVGVTPVALEITTEFLVRH